MAQLGWSAKADVDPRPAPIDWGSAPVERVEPAGPPLRIGAYVTNISDIDLLQDQFSVEMLLWTTWAGDPQADPSDQLMILNGIYDGDIQRFERVSHEQTAAGAFTSTGCVRPWSKVGGCSAIPLTTRCFMSRSAWRIHWLS